MIPHHPTSTTSDREVCCDDIAEWYLRHAPTIRRYALMAMRDPIAADDCTSETFLRALARRDLFRCQGWGPRPWLAAIARNFVNDQRRRVRHRREICTEFIPERPDHATTPEHAVLDQVTAAEVERCLDLIPPDQAQCIRLRFFEGLTVREAAEAMNRRDDAVRALQHRALRSLEPLVTARDVA